MENPAFLDIEQSLYGSNSSKARGVPFNMSQRRPPHHLPTLHHPQQAAHAHAVAAAAVVVAARGGGGGVSQQHPAHLTPQASLMTGPQTTQMHNGRVIGVIGTRSSNNSSNIFPDPSLPPMYPSRLAGVSGSHHPHVTHSEPMYSCQAPRGHDHVYQCPGHRQGENIDPREHMEHIQHHLDPRGQLDHREHHLDNREQQYLEHREHQLDPREHHLDMREHPRRSSRDNHLDPRQHQYLDQREQHLEHTDSIEQRLEHPREQHLDTREQRLDNRDARLELRDQRQERGLEGRLDPSLDQRRGLESRLDPSLDQRRGLENRLDPSLDQRRGLEGRLDPSLDQRRGLEGRLDPSMDQRRGLEGRLDPSMDQRPEYHYGGSDYSSTEPIYAQPTHLYPNEIGTHTPTLSFNNMRASLRAAGSAGGTPAKFLVRSDSCGNSTASSTLPTVSALLARDSSGAHTGTPVAARSSQSLRASLPRHSKGGGSVTPTKLKRQGLFRAWKVKFLRGEGSRRKACLLLAVLAFVLILVLGILGTVLYLTLGGGLSSFVGTSPKLIEITETGSSVVEGEFSITNQNFQPAFADLSSEPYRSIAKSIQNELDILFTGSVWSREYNHSRVVSLSPGSLMVRVQLFLNNADVAAAQKLGSAFLRGLHNRHGHEWLGPYAINITSIRFAEVLVDTPTLSSSPSPAVPGSGHMDSTSTVAAVRPTPHLNVGWGSWGPWSTCSPCSPQYDQIRTRQCRLDAGRGLLINSIEPCLPLGLGGQLQGSGGDMETRPCQCHREVDDSSTSTTTTTVSPPPSPVTAPATTTTTTTTEKADNEQDENTNNSDKERLCDSCLPGEVCVGLQGEAYPTCREPLDAADPTGCGGLCIMDSEVCQALGSRAFSCHSASQCLHDEWRCADGLCIPHIKRCDGHMNCYDQSDEQHCDCAQNEFQCGNNTSCLPISAKCDGKMDCWDGSDEANCTTSDSVSPSSSSVTAWRTAGMGQMNPEVVPDAANPTSINAGVADASQQPPFVIGGTRVAMPVMNRTAIGLSSLSHRERELLS